MLSSPAVLSSQELAEAWLGRARAQRCLRCPSKRQPQPGLHPTPFVEGDFDGALGVGDLAASVAGYVAKKGYAQF